jgi:hypothetical protein
MRANVVDRPAGFEISAPLESPHRASYSNEPQEQRITELVAWSPWTVGWNANASEDERVPRSER